MSQREDRVRSVARALRNLTQAARAADPERLREAARAEELRADPSRSWMVAQMMAAWPEKEPLKGLLMALEALGGLQERYGPMTGEGMWEPLHWAAWSLNEELVKALIEAGADTRSVTSEGQSTALMMAVAMGADIAQESLRERARRVASSLIEAGSDLSALDARGRGAIGRAAAAGASRMIRELAGQAARRGVAPSEDWSGLMRSAMEKGQEQTALALIEAGWLDQPGIPELDRAVDRGFESIAQAIWERHQNAGRHEELREALLRISQSEGEASSSRQQQARAWVRRRALAIQEAKAMDECSRGVALPRAEKARL